MISNRIEQLMNELGYNKNSFSHAIGLKNNVTIGRIIRQQRQPSYPVLLRILQTFGNTIDAHWLLTGEGNMKKNYLEKVNPEEKEIKSVLRNLKGLSDSMTRELNRLNK